MKTEGGEEEQAFVPPVVLARGIRVERELLRTRPTRIPGGDLGPVVSPGNRGAYCGKRQCPRGEDGSILYPGLPRGLPQAFRYTQQALVSAWPLAVPSTS